MASSRSIIIAGAGIGGLTAALALAAKGFGVTVLEKAPGLEETGAGIQLTPNATRILLALGLGDRLWPGIVTPEAIAIHNGRSGALLARIPLGASAEQRYGAPYWLVHRADLQAALLDAVRVTSAIELVLGSEVVDFTPHESGVTVMFRRDGAIDNADGRALIGADGLRSALRGRLGNTMQPRFARRTAWRSLVPASAVAPEWRQPLVHLWLGRGAHLVHYPVKRGELVNIVAIVRDERESPGWSEHGDRLELRERFAPLSWSPAARALLASATSWQKWSLYDAEPCPRWGADAVTLLGDAAHPALPFLAQGAAMSIEDAAVLAHAMAGLPDDPARALRDYEAARRRRTGKSQAAARKNASIYQLAGPAGFVRNLVLRMSNGEALLKRYDWIYNWRPTIDAASDRQP